MVPERPTRLEILDRLNVPDLWPEVTRRREGAPPPGGPSPLRRVGIVALALLVAGLGFLLVLRLLPAPRHRPATSPSPTVAVPSGNGMIYFRSQVRSGVPTSWEAVSSDGTGLHTVFPDSGSFVPDHLSFSPDGQSIAVNLVGRSGIWIADADGSHAVQLTNGANDAWPTWSPDETKIAFAGSTASTPCPPGRFEYLGCHRDLYVVNADGTGLQLVANDAIAPSWSPDGGRIAFESTAPATSIEVVNADGTDEHVLTSTPTGSDFAPAWSPDGDTIMYASIRMENWGIFAVPAAGGEERTLVPPGMYVDDPTWSPDGKLIAFVAGDGIDVMAPDGSHISSLVSQQTKYPAGSIAWQPIPVTTSSPSPPETTTPGPQTPSSNGLIAFGCGYHICTMSPDGTNITDLTKPDDATIVLAAYGPVWSPDGTKIAFYGFPRGAVRGGANYDVYVMNADGSGVTNLTTSPADVASWFSQLDPKWSPDGTKIVYDGDDGLYVMNADGSDQTRVATGQDATWSPDGTRIAFEGPSGAIWSVAPDGSGLGQLTSGAGFDGFPAYSPEGSKIAYFHGQGNDRAIYVMNADGSHQARVADFQADTMGRPVWSPDGSRLAFDLYYTNQTWDIYVVHSDGTGLADVANDPNRDENDPVWSPDGTTVAFQASQVLARDTDNTGTFDIYVMNPDGTGQMALTHNLGTSGGSDMHWQRLETDQAP